MVILWIAYTFQRLEMQCTALAFRIYLWAIIRLDQSSPSVQFNIEMV